MNVKTKTEIHNIVESDIVEHHIRFDPFVDPNGKDTSPKEDIVRKNTKIKPIISTDGEIIKTEFEEPQPINNYYIKGKKYKCPSHTFLIKSKTHIKNASYIILYTMAKEAITSRKSEYVIKNIEIFLNNKKDKLALKRAKESIIEFKKDYIIDGTCQPERTKQLIKEYYPM